ncbi:uncharacterized protein LOC126215206 [Schistocerca nitens]|uniref:uncharacterized protein LOC126215206 n=1 Tax=Schistocerca nitens TaxID=7011 RepID=UPI002117DC76|nr:uncharacterized protein LOC126215206 [Schistocerca nitens]
MVMAADGTAALLPDAGVQLQGVLPPQPFAGATAGGLVIRATGVGQAGVGAQAAAGKFLSPAPPQFLVNGNAFSGQLSPLVAAGVSPTQHHQVTFQTTTQPQVRPEFLQCATVQQTQAQQAGTVHAQHQHQPQQQVPQSQAQQCSATVVQHNTTIVQQQTTMVASSRGQLQVAGQQQSQPQTVTFQPRPPAPATKQSVSTQTAGASCQGPVRSSPPCGSGQLQPAPAPTLLLLSGGPGPPPDTTTHSPSSGPQPSAADTTTEGLASPCPGQGVAVASSSGTDVSGMPMVHCVSSSNEQEPAGYQVTPGSAAKYPRPDSYAEPQPQHYRQQTQQSAATGRRKAADGHRHGGPEGVSN